MRTIKLTHEQIDLLINCLQIASSEYNKQYIEMCKRFPNDVENHKKYWFNKANTIYDLSEDIKDGKFDV